jgi:signal transduction histidine kinase
MQRLVKELELVRIGPDKIPILPQPTRLLSDVIIPAKRFIEPLLKQRGFNRIQIHDAGVESLPKVDIDRALITQAVFNLLDNAIKYFPADRPAADFSCMIEGRQVGAWIELSVRDNGPGLSEEDAAGLFSFGFRGANAAQSNVGGTGIGLWLSKAIAKRHGGDLVMRRRHQPTEFVLILAGPPQRKYPYIS